MLPNNLCRAFSHRREMAVNVNLYKDGASQVGLLVSAGAPRLAWSLGYRLSASALVTLRGWYEAWQGSQWAFYFYDLANEKTAVYDPTGAATTGRYTVRFSGGWQQSMGIGRGDVQVELVQVY